MSAEQPISLNERFSVKELAEFRQMAERPYTIRIEPDPDSSLFIASVAELHGCYAVGQTRAQADERIKVAMEAWFALATLHHWAIPEPQLMG